MSHIRFGRPNVRADGRETGLPGPGTIWEAGIPGVGGTNDGDEGDLDHRPALHPLSSRAEARRVQTHARERPESCQRVLRRYRLVGSRASCPERPP